MSFIRKIQTVSGTYLARVENKRVDGKVKQTVIEWLGKSPDTDEIVYKRLHQLADRMDKMQKRRTLAREKYVNLHEATLKAARKALGGRYIDEDEVDNQGIEMTLQLIKLLISRKWYTSIQLTAASGGVLRPEMASREDPKGKHDIDRGREVIVTRELKELLSQKRIETRPGNDRINEWRLKDRDWAKKILAEVNAVIE